MVTDFCSRQVCRAGLTLAFLGGVFLLTGGHSQGQGADAQASDAELKFSEGDTGTTPTGVSFHGPFGRQTLYITADTPGPHEFIDISLDLLIMRSWDGSVLPTGDDLKPIDIGPDFMCLALRDGPILLYTTFSNTPADPPGFSWETKMPNYPSQVPGDRFLPWTGAAEKNTLGYVYPFPGPPVPVPQDAVYKIHFVVPHKGEKVRLELTGINLQSIEDENWGVRNVSIKGVARDQVKKPVAKEIAASFEASLDMKTEDLPGKFQVLINGMDDTVEWLRKNVKPMPEDAARVAKLIEARAADDDLVVPGKSTHVALVSMGYAIEPALRDARKKASGEARLRLDETLSILDVVPLLPKKDGPMAAAIPPELAERVENQRRLVLATRVLEIIGTEKALALRHDLTLAAAHPATKPVP